MQLCDFSVKDACEWVGFCPADKGAGKGKGKKGREEGSVEDKVEAVYQAIEKMDSKDVRPTSLLT